MTSVLSRLQTAAEGPGTITFVGSAAGDAGPADRVEWARLHDDARAMAAALQARGVGPGVHVGLLGPTSRALVTAIQAVFLAGGTVVALPLPMRLGSIEEFVEQTRQRIANADAALVLVDGDLAPFLDPLPASTPRSSCSTTSCRRARAWAPRRGCDRPTIPTAWPSCSSPAGRPRHRRA